MESEVFFTSKDKDNLINRMINFNKYYTRIIIDQI